MFRFKTVHEMVEEDIHIEPGYRYISGVGIENDVLVQHITTPSYVVRIRLNRMGMEVQVSSLCVTKAPLQGRLTDRWFKKTSDFELSATLGSISVWTKK